MSFSILLSNIFHRYGQSAIILLLLSVALSQAANVNYCNLCQNHIGCRNNGSFGSTCSSDRGLLKMTSAQKEYILKLHNRMRNSIALGRLPNYSSAAKMPYFQWDNELAYLAELNARSCEYGHDVCRATNKYHWAGQNIARRGNTKGYEKTTNAIKNMISGWFNEYKDANMNYINSYHNHVFGKKIGHFTVMVNDKNNAVGCAVSRYQQTGYKYHYLVCNYSFTNILEQTVYEKGPATSKCKKPHPVYKGLCSADQKVSHSP